MVYQVKVIDGKVELPPSIVKELGLTEGTRLLVNVVNGEATISRDRYEELKKHLDQLQPPGVSAVDDLIAERRAEAILSDDEFRQWLIERNRSL
jgi:antitoxin component of MazEF toxin-antitoxin module